MVNFQAGQLSRAYSVLSKYCCRRYCMWLLSVNCELWRHCWCCRRHPRCVFTSQLQLLRWRRKRPRGSWEKRRRAKRASPPRQPLKLRFSRVAHMVPKPLFSATPNQTGLLQPLRANTPHITPGCWRAHTSPNLPASASSITDSPYRDFALDNLLTTTLQRSSSSTMHDLLKQHELAKLQQYKMNRYKSTVVAF